MFFSKISLLLSLSALSLSSSSSSVSAFTLPSSSMSIAFRPSTTTSKTASKATSKTTSTSTMMAVEDNTNDDAATMSRRSIFSTAATIILSSSSSLLTLPLLPLPANARLDPVNNPSLLPSSPDDVVIQTEKFLTSGQVKRMSDLIVKLERDTGFRLRVLCQNYPNTPGLAIRDYWDLGKEGQKDDKYIVLVVDQFGGRGNVLNFNVGDGVKFALPNVFWTRLSSKYGTTFFVRENGIDIAITNAVEAIVQCLRSEEAYCVNVPDQGVSMRTLGL